MDGLILSDDIVNSQLFKSSSKKIPWRLHPTRFVDCEYLLAINHGDYFAGKVIHHAMYATERELLIEPGTFMRVDKIEKEEKTIINDKEKIFQRVRVTLFSKPKIKTEDLQVDETVMSSYSLTRN